MFLFLNKISINLAVQYLKSREAGSYIQTASPHFGSKVCSASPEVSLVLVPDELHHKLTGLLQRGLKNTKILKI